MVWRTKREGTPPWSLWQRARLEGLHQGVPDGMESGSETVRLDGDSRLDY